MIAFDNSYCRNPDYINKSGITRSLLNKWCISKEITIEQAKRVFDCCKKVKVKTGVSENSSFSRVTTYVLVSELCANLNLYIEKNKIFEGNLYDRNC